MGRWTSQSLPFLARSVAAAQTPRPPAS
jgi:hypothetical protein